MKKLILLIILFLPGVLFSQEKAVYKNGEFKIIETPKEEKIDTFIFEGVTKKEAH